MASMLKRMMIYLGVAPDEEYDDLEEYDSPARPPTVPQQAPSEYETGTLRTLPPPVAPPHVEAPRIRPAVRPVTPTAARVETVAPRSFNDAQEIADKFKSSQPVIVNLQGAARELSRRLIDFTSGLCYGLGGQMERVADNVYLLTPTDVEVSAEDRRRLQERGLIDEG
jgi:cell division inhibitor SepF